MARVILKDGGGKVVRLQWIRFRTRTTLHIRQGNGQSQVRGQVDVDMGALCKVSLRAYVKNFVEVADLIYGDGTEAVGVPYANFQFVDDERTCETG
jgi:hypothetical protein